MAAEEAVDAFRHPRQSPGYRPDVVSEGAEATDAMNVSGEVQALCELITAFDATPPISIGLFGPWGSGKSFFMRLMRQEINRRSRRLVNDPNSVFCQRVKQIVFNAWHYADDNHRQHDNHTHHYSQLNSAQRFSLWSCRL